MPTESDLTKNIPNESISQFYWILFIGVSILAGIVVVLDLYLMTVNVNAGLAMLLRSVPVLLIAMTNMLFMHVLSARALK
jgi:hypothetical protein